METSQPLSIESFSYSWLVNLNPSFETLDDTLKASLNASDEASFIEMDPKLPASRRFFRGSHDFNFAFPISQESPLTHVHADELISNGFLVPFFIKPLNMEAYDSSDSASTTPISSHVPKNAHSGSKIHCPSLRRCRRLSKRLLQKYLDFFRPLCRKLQVRRSGSRNEAVVGTRMQEVNSWICSAATSPRASVAYSVDDWRRSCDSESSIHEAVLHCKRSIGK